LDEDTVDWEELVLKDYQRNVLVNFTAEYGFIELYYFDVKNLRIDVTEVGYNLDHTLLVDKDVQRVAVLLDYLVENLQNKIS
jgi:hypothetical protein